MAEIPRRSRTVVPPLSHSNFRDIRPRVRSLTPPPTKKLGKMSLGKTKRRTMDGMLEQQPEDNRGKLRKSNSENRRPPAPQSDFGEVFERKRSSRRMLEQISTKVAESKLLEDEECKSVREKSEIRESEDKSAYGKLKNVRIDLTPVQTHLTPAITPSLPSQAKTERTVTSSLMCPSSASGSLEVCNVGIQTQTDLSTCCPTNVAILEDLADLKTNVKAIQQSIALLLSYTEVSPNQQDTQAPNNTGGEGKSADQNTEKLSRNEEDRGVEENFSTCNDQLNPETHVQGRIEVVDDINRAARKALLADSSLEELDTDEEDPTVGDYEDDDVLVGEIGTNSANWLSSLDIKSDLTGEEVLSREVGRLCDLGTLERRRGDRKEGKEKVRKPGKVRSTAKQSRSLNAISSDSDSEAESEKNSCSEDEVERVENMRSRRMLVLESDENADSYGGDEDYNDSEDGREDSFDDSDGKISEDEVEDEDDGLLLNNLSGNESDSSSSYEVATELDITSTKNSRRCLPDFMRTRLTDSDGDKDDGEVKFKSADRKIKVRSRKEISGSKKDDQVNSDSANDFVADDEYCQKEFDRDQDCSCPSCRMDNNQLVKFSGKDLQSSVSRKAAKKSEVYPSPPSAPPQLDSYFNSVDVSFDELDHLSQSGSQSDSDQEAGRDMLVNNKVVQDVVLQQQQTKKIENVCLDELWKFKERHLVGKGKTGIQKVEEGEDKEKPAVEGSIEVGTERDEEDIIGDEEEYGVKETYSDYTPVYLSYGLPHPDSVVESSSLASVLHPAITRELHLPQDLIDQGRLSKVQLEAVVYASQMHEKIMPNNSRAGYLIGDGAGVGKGRTIAGIILENWMCGRKKAVWISASQDLKLDAGRDLEDIGAKGINVESLTKFAYDKEIKWEGVIYCTFAGLVGTTKDKSKRFQSRLEQLLDWLGKEGQFQGPVVFDECHMAKNLIPPKGGKPTKTGLAVLDLQNKNPMARVVYASATGASEPKNMAYMVRLGMWGQKINFRDFKEFSGALEKRGTGGLEQVALDLKLRGNYIARQLSFQGVDFSIEEVPLSHQFVSVYDQSVEVWRKLQVLVYDQCNKYPPITNRGDPRKRNFWGFMQKFFKYLAISSKISHVVGMAKKELAAGNCVVIGLQSTGEAATETEMINKVKEKVFEIGGFDEDSDDLDSDEITSEKVNQFSSAASKMVKSVLTRLTPCQHTPVRGECDPAKCGERKEVWDAVMELVPLLPTSSLDMLIEQLGGPKKVAELTGRKKRLERGCDGVYSYVKRMPESGSCDKINISEKNLFMSDKKRVAIISDAASTGISLQADKRVKNQRRRVHITIELPWSADSAIQQFGRTHRSNQSSAPKYVFIISALHGEKRFASIVAKRLESLGALTHGDRRSTRTSDLSTFNYHTDYAVQALKNMVLAITEGENIPMPKPPAGWNNKEEFYTWLADRMEEAGIYSIKKVLDDEKYPSINKFMNKLLCVKVNDQNVIFSFFTATLDRVIAQAKREGRYDTGIVDVVGQEKATQLEQNSFKVKHATGTTTTQVTKFLITKGMSFDEAVDMSKNLHHNTEGFWVSRRKGLNLALLVIAIPDAGHYRMWKYLVYRPNTGKVFSTMLYEDLREKYQKVRPEVAQRLWDRQYDMSMTMCFHAYKSKDHTCKIIRNGGECEEGKRRRNYHVISGSLLSVWPQIEIALGSCLNKSARKIQMVRINNDEGRIIGINIPNQVAGGLINSLKDLDLSIGNRVLNDEEKNRGYDNKQAKNAQLLKAGQDKPDPVVVEKHLLAGLEGASGKSSLVRQISQQAAGSPQSKQSVVPPLMPLAQCFEPIPAGSLLAQQCRPSTLAESACIENSAQNIKKLIKEGGSSQPLAPTAPASSKLASNSSSSSLPCSPPTDKITITPPFAKRVTTFFRRDLQSGTASPPHHKFFQQPRTQPIPSHSIAPPQLGPTEARSSARPPLSPLVMQLASKTDVEDKCRVMQKERSGGSK